jgi:hypothetical protein
VKSRRLVILHKKTFEYWHCGNYLQDVNVITRCAAVTVAICSWLAASNHCAFAAVAPSVENAHSDCPFHSKPAKQKQQSSQVQCCKILRAVVFAKAKDWARDNTRFCDTTFPVLAGGFVGCPSCVVAPLLLDTGPPGALSFAELILQQSLLAHAPPYAA